MPEQNLIDDTMELGVVGDLFAEAELEEAFTSFHDMDEIFLRGISDRTKPNVSLLCKQPNVLNQSGKKIEEPVGCD